MTTTTRPRQRRQHVHLTGRVQRPATANLSERPASAFLTSLRAAAAKPAPTPAPVAPAAESTLTAKTLHMVEDVRQPFAELSTLQGGLAVKSKTLAPRFMRAYNAWAAETGGTFVGFVVLLDPAVPADRAGYRGNASYQAAEYLRRLVAAKAKPEATTGADAASKPASMVEALAAVLATVAPSVDMQALWTAFETKLHWSTAAVKRLQQRVGESPPSLLSAKATTRRAA